MASDVIKDILDVPLTLLIGLCTFLLDAAVGALVQSAAPLVAAAMTAGLALVLAMAWLRRRRDPRKRARAGDAVR